MHILFVADGRSPIALNWIRFFVDRGEQVHLVSTFQCKPDLALASLTYLPVAFSQAKGKGHPDSNASPSGRGVWGGALVGARTRIRQLLGPLTLRRSALHLSEIIKRIRPDLLHAMRIPYEGMVSALANSLISGSHTPEYPKHTPLLVSVWGNDFTLHAPSTPWMRHYTRFTLRHADALHTDCFRDQRLARVWGLEADKPAIILPGGGGIQPDLFYPPASEAQRLTPLVINPRGFRAYVRNDTFFRSIPRVLERQPETRLLCTGMEGDPRAIRWLKKLDIAHNVELLPVQTRPQMAELFRKAQVTVSPTTHDGTPNTLLEAMACGCFPVVGDLDSLREWITQGENGLLVDPADPEALAKGILIALEQPDLRMKAAGINARLVAERAIYPQVMEIAEDFYQKLVGG